MVGDDLAKEVKELTEVNRVGKKVATNYGSRHDSRNTRQFNNYDSKGRGYRNRRPFLGWRNNKPTVKQPKPATETKTSESEVSVATAVPICTDDVEVRSRPLAVSNDKIGRRLKQFFRQWRCLTSDWFLLDSVQHYKIEFAQTPEQESVPKD